ncbi:MAG: GNAT family N-acetyltransferase [Candidatus Dormibacteria bacterium]
MPLDEKDPFVAACTTLVTLRDGTRIRIRPIVRSDREQIEAGFEHLSAASRRGRFFTPLQQLPESLLRYLTEIDYRNHVALGAAAVDDPGEPGVAIARYVRCVDEPDCAEAAVTVLDEYQRRGIATVLLKALALIALQSGITRFCAYVQWGNPEVVKLARALGASVKHDSVGVARVDIALSAPAVRIGETALGVALRTLARREASLAPRGATPSNSDVSRHV